MAGDFDGDIIEITPSMYRQIQWLRFKRVCYRLFFSKGR